MELHQIRYVLAVARERNFTRAAEVCNVSQPSLSRAVRQFEEEIGGPVFMRRPGRIEATELGRLVLPRLERAQTELREVRDDAIGYTRGQRARLRLGLTCCIGPQRLVHHIARARARIPSLTVSVREAKAETLLDMLHADEIDAAVMALPDHPEDIVSVPIYLERFAVAFAAGHSFSQSTEVPLEALAGHEFVQRAGCLFRDFFERVHGRWPLELDVRGESDREDWVQAMVSRGLGVTVVPEGLPLMAGIDRRPLVAPETVRHVSILTVRGRRHNAATEALVRVVKADVRAGPFDEPNGLGTELAPTKA
jgi:LysR family hydrogen peroxide-inducible transcriptional activator